LSIPAANQILTYENQLQIAFTSAFEYVNNSDGSGIEDVSWWRPRPPDGFYPLGDLTHPGFGDANGVGLIATVKGMTEGVLQPPIGFTKVGTFMCGRIDHLWFWRPTPPPGYVSLGLVVGAPGDTPPSPDVVMCIREDLVVPSSIGGMVWGGHGDESLARLWGGSGAPSRSFRLQVRPILNQVHS
jgi:Vacuolar protein sorting-associated protein 62